MAVGPMIWWCHPYTWIMGHKLYSTFFPGFFCWDITPRLEYSKFQQDNFQCFWNSGSFVREGLFLGTSNTSGYIYIYIHKSPSVSGKETVVKYGNIG